MKGLPFVLLFTAMTFIAWGAYGPVLHHGTIALDNDALRAFVGVGLAYFLIAVLIPLAIIQKSRESGSWTFGGIVFSIIAGAVGALGALGIILALGYGGETVYVMPIVFGFAPVVNTLVTSAIGRTFGQIRPIFMLGIITAALGAVGVLTFRSSATAPPKPDVTTELTPVAWRIDEQSQATNDQAPESTPPADSVTTPESEPVIEQALPQTPTASGDTASDSSSFPANPKPEDAKAASITPKGKDVTKIALSILMAAVCWGSYGPMLHIGQAKMSGSRLRPFICVGIAYFLIAVLVPLWLIYSRSQDAGAWSGSGLTWSFFAGIAGALGALGVILAFNAGGKPIYVMPLIFGFAPVINTFISLSEKGSWHLVHPLFWVSLAVVITGAVTVLVTAPKPQPKPGN